MAPRAISPFEGETGMPPTETWRPIVTSTEKNVLETLGIFEKEVVSFSIHIKKVGARVAKSRKALASRPSSVELEKLVTDLRTLAKGQSPPNVTELVDALDKQLPVLRNGLADSFIESLRQMAAKEQLYFHSAGDEFAVGPFLLSVNLAKERASLAYAKVEVAQLPLVPAECLRLVKQLKAEIIDQPVDLAVIRGQLQEALRVIAARKGKSLAGALRGELPHIFREVGFMRQSDSARGSQALSLSRFVVELGRLIQSDANIDSEKRLRLETAVLDNTKNSLKSIFIPKDLSQGFGEGTYYQALIQSAS